MPDESEEVMLRIGFMPSPDAQAQLEALGKAAIEVQKKIDDAGKQSGGLASQTTAARETAKAISGVGDAVDKAITAKKRDTETFVSGEKEKQRAIKETAKAEAGLEDLFGRLRRGRGRVNKLRDQQAAPPSSAPPAQGSSFADLFGASSMEGAQLLSFVDKVEKQIGKGSEAFEQFEKTGSKSLRSLNKELANLRGLAKQGPGQLQQAFESGRIERAVVATARLGNEVTKQNVAFRKLTRQYASASAEAATYRRRAQAAFASASQGATQVAVGVGQVSQGFILLNGILEDHKTKVIGAADSTKKLDLDTVDLLAKIQGGIQVFTGAEKAIGGFVRTIDGLSGYFKANALAKTALNRATQAEIQLSRFRMSQMTAETVAVQAQTAAVLELAAARGLASNAGLGGAAGGAGRSVAGGVARGAGGQLAAGAAGGIAAKGLGTGGLVAGASVGAIVTATVAAVAGTGFYLKSLFETAKEVDRAGFGQGAEVGGFVDTIASAEVSVLDWVGATTGFFDLLGTTARKEAEERLAATKRQKAAEARIDEIRIKAEQRRFRSEIETSQRMLDLRLSAEGKTAAQRGNDIREEITKALSQLGGIQDQIAAPGADKDQQQFTMLREQELTLLERVRQLRASERSESKEAAREKRQSLLEEIDATEQILRNRLSEIKAIDDRLKSNKERFVLADARDQRAAVRAFERARDGGNLNQEQIRALQLIDTEEAKRLRERQIDRLAGRTKFEDVTASERERRRRLEQESQFEIDKINASLREADSDQQVSGIQELRAKISIDPKIEVVDRRQFQIETDRVVEAIDQKYIELTETLIREIDEAVDRKNREQENQDIVEFRDRSS